MSNLSEFEEYKHQQRLLSKAPNDPEFLDRIFDEWLERRHRGLLKICLNLKSALVQAKREYGAFGSLSFETQQQMWRAIAATAYIDPSTEVEGGEHEADS